MKAISVVSPGPATVMTMVSVPDPIPQAHEVLVQIRATGVNPVDTYIRAGKYAWLPEFPYIPGNDAAGSVVAVGNDVSQFAVGERVYMTGNGLGLGAYAEFVACPANKLARIPDTVSFEQAAAINVPYATAHRALSRGGLRAGETVLIHGASGGVGIAAVQMAVAAGARVIATAGTERGLELVRAQGAHYVCNHSSPDYIAELLGYAPRKIDLIIENLANVNLDADLQVLATYGRVVIVGSRGRAEIDPRAILQKDANVCGMALWNATAEELERIHAALFAGLANGTLRPVIGRRYPLAAAAAAHNAILEPGAFGKIILQP